VKGLVSTLAVIWRLAAPYFWSEDRWPGRILLAAVIVIELALVAMNVALNWWNARFFNALQEKNWDNFVSELLFWCIIAVPYIVLAVYQVYLNQWLQIRWRRWMTERYLGQWLDHANHYRMQLLGDAADNPDQRIAEDIRQFISAGGTGVGILPIGIGLLSAVVTLASFVVILWTLSATAPLHLFGVAWNIPGYLVWVALLYALLGTMLTHLIGRVLIGLNFNQQRLEADFRFTLVRVRENSEQIALLNGEVAERDRLLDRFGAIMANWLRIMTRTKRLTFLTAGYTQVSNVFPYVVVSPAYFAGTIQLGVLTQTADAFGQVQTSLSFFINVYRQIAEWLAVVERLAGFEAAIAAGREAAQTPPAVSVTPRPAAKAVAVDGLALDLPNGVPLVACEDITFSAAERVLLTGPTGAGKSTLFRAIGGIWPFGAGTVTVPAGARVLTLPQRPYFPVGSLEAAISYPAVPGTFEGTRLAEVLVAVGLPGLTSRLDEHAHWNRMLSLGEQQRLALARAILLEPDYLFLDEATASLDEASEAALYRLLQERLPGMAIVSIGHRSTLEAFHRRRLVLERDGARYRVCPQEPALAPGE
jgi:vitamin B12/bleomycin/antimicrobial peptide transport system ATP-binding/permease protein